MAKAPTKDESTGVVQDVSSDPTPTLPDVKFAIEFDIPPDMLETFARIGLEFVLKQRMQEINNMVKK